MGSSDTSNSSGRRLKVARLIDEYDLDGIGEQMEQLWTTSGDDRMSLRQLADFFNQRLLRTAMTAAGMQPLTGEVENTNHVLTGDDISEAGRTRMVRRLEREEIDIEQLQKDLVTHQAIRTYLREHRNASYERDY